MMARRSPAATESDTPSTARSAPKIRATRSSESASPDAMAGPLVVTRSPPRGGPGAGRRSRAVGHVPRAEPDLVELGLGHSEALVDLGDHLDDLVVEAAVGGLGHLGHE